MPLQDYTKRRFWLILCSFIGNKEGSYGFLYEWSYAVDVPAEDVKRC